MRTYIFTERERVIIRAFLSGEKTGGMDIARIKYMVKAFMDLASDVDLYLELRSRLAESKTATSA